MNQQTAPPHPIIATLLLVATTFFWGITFTVVKDAVLRVDVFFFLSQRFILASVVMVVPGLLLKGIPDRGTIRAGMILGAALFASYAFQTAALLYTSASNTAFLTGISVVLVPLLGRIFFGRTTGRKEAAGALLASAGLYLLCTGGSFVINRGDLLGLACAFCIALHILLTGRYAHRHDVFWVTAIQLSTIAILSTVVALARGEEITRLYPFLFWPLVICALFATVFAFWVQTSMQRFIPPARTALIFCLEPVFAAGYAAIVAGERLSPTGWTGAILILSGMLLTELPARRLTS